MLLLRIFSAVTIRLHQTPVQETSVGREQVLAVLERVLNNKTLSPSA